ncbi:Uncharacterised protein [Sphingobacterium spiritivorum]|uniref:DUF6808 domain-containing protein n=1 Tax=Sphingobacterium spiritivorum TaxID=258 RepID=A0A380CS40_SPHSI|nr:hypothetical protein [Sphingobacterium spiritivorum]SUJ26534.1 Uncharacterised protein [Sphingobacterium spiritivorum]
MKEKIILIALAFMVLVSGILSYNILFRKPEVKYITEAAPNIINEAQTEAKIIAASVDNKGYSRTVAIRKDAILSNGDISQLPVSQKVLDSLRLADMDKNSRLQQASAVIGKLEAKNLRASAIIDSLNRTSYLYKDDFAIAKFTPDSQGGTFDIDWRLKLVRHDYKKRKTFLSPYTYYTDILSPDSRITISELQNLTIESHKPTRWGVGLQGGYYFDPQQGKFTPAIGVGLSYNIIRF